MIDKESIQPAIIGAIVGAAALAIIGFSWGGWETANGARKLANNEARDQVVAALVPFCLQRSEADPDSIATLAKLKDTSSYQRSAFLMQTGWATMPGGDKPNRDVANACVEKLAANF